MCFVVPKLKWFLLKSRQSPEKEPVIVALSLEWIIKSLFYTMERVSHLGAEKMELFILCTHSAPFFVLPLVSVLCVF